jgi:thiol:disulfide interchange protein
VKLAIVLVLAACSSAQPTVTIYTAEWCAACRVFERDTLADPGVRAELAQFSVATVDVDREPTAGIDVLPTIVLPNARLAGAPSRAAFVAALQRARSFTTPAFASSSNQSATSPSGTGP